ncbi:mst89B [Cochliomyia hominivorax]
MFSARQLLQNSEESLNPVHVPFNLGPDFFIFSYQDVRKIQDSRLFGLRQLLPNGDFKSLNLQNLYEFLLQILKQENFMCNPNFCQLLEFLNNKRIEELQQQQQNPYYTRDAVPSCPQPMEVSVESNKNPAIASIEQQLQWDKCVNTSAPFPMSYCQSTSTTQLSGAKTNLTSNSCRCCGSSKTPKHFCNKSVNTLEESQEEIGKTIEILGAREQLKKKKQQLMFNF